MRAKKYPLGFWNVEDYLEDVPRRVREWQELHFSLAMTPHFDGADATSLARVRDLLDRCAEAGIEVILCDQRTQTPSGNWMDPSEPRALPPDYESRAAGAVRDFADHPAVWGFYVTDEPLAGNLPAVAEACQILRGLTDRTPYVNLLPDHRIFGTVPEDVIKVNVEVGFDDYGQYLDHYLRSTGNDLLCYDCYASGSDEWGGWDNYYRNLAHYQAASLRHNVPFWFIMLSAGHWMYQAPSPTRMSRQFHTALAYGAQGVLYFLYRAGQPFAYGAPVDEGGQRSALFGQLVRQHQRFRRAWEPTFRQLTPVRTLHSPQAPPGLPRFDGAGAIRDLRHRVGIVPLVIGEFRGQDNHRYVMIVSDDDDRHTWLEVTFAAKSVEQLEWPRTQRVGQTHAGGVTASFPLLPGQGLLFRLHEREG